MEVKQKIVEELGEKQLKWCRHIKRLPKQILNWIPPAKGKRRPRKKCRTRISVMLKYLPKPATMLLALALPTLRVVFGSLLGGRGACSDLFKTWLPPTFLGKVAYCLLMGTSTLPPGKKVDLLIGIPPAASGSMDTTVICTRFPDFLIKSTTCS